MVRKGFTGIGTQRWYCRSCALTAIRTRHDNRKRSDRLLLARWMTSVEELTAIAKRQGFSREHLSRRLRDRWPEAPFPPILDVEDDALVIDAISCGDGVAFILRTIDWPRATWGFGPRENAIGWYEALSLVKGEPRAIVSDHQKGLRLAVRLRFPDALHQRCQAHIVRLALIWITRRPKTLAGKTLKTLVLRLSKVETEHEARQWSETLLRWHIHVKPFLSEKTQGPHGWWYMHKYLRKATALLLGAMPEAFTFTIASKIPKTSNHVEGGLNAQLKERLMRHRGLSSERQRALVAFFLTEWNRKKSCTRNVT